jgi:maltooligosyltrehalose trehalohydrolase
VTTWKLERGAILEKGGVRFSVWAPRARRVDVVLESEKRAIALAGDGEGGFSALVEGVAEGALYRFRLDGERERPDPVSRSQPRGVHDASAVVDPSAFAWRDAGWRGLELPSLVLYELHVGTFTPEGTFAAAIEKLPLLRDLGVTAVELMPVAEFPGGRNWGYDGVHSYAAESTYGGPAALAKLVDAAHAIGLGVVLDVVYNHLGPEGNYLAEYGPYFTDRHRTPWGSAINFDDEDCDEVRRYFVDNALHWVTDFHVDGLRLDAVHAIYDFGARHVLEEIATAVHEQAASLRRTALVIAESDLNDPRIVRPREIGGYGLDGQWSDDFHHAVHAAVTGERRGYYQDFGGVAPIAKALRDRFFVEGQRSSFRRRRHGAPATDVPAERFVVFVQNHDQVGNRAAGDRLTTLVEPAKRRLATSLCLLSPYVPLLFMGEEWGETAPFLYFTSHGDPALAEAVRRGRREEFRRFDWPGEVPDPQSEETFARSRLDWSRREREGEPARTLALHRALLALREEEPALRAGGTDLFVMGAELDRGEGWIVAARSAALFTAFNVSATAIAAPLPERLAGSWVLRFSSEASAFGGSGDATARVTDGRLMLPPWSAALFAKDGEK